MAATMRSERCDQAVQPLDLLGPEVPDYLRGILAGHGDLVPVSALPPDGTFATGTACLEKRNLASEVPVWDAGHCIECGKCVVICPHSAIRAKLVERGDAHQLRKGVLSQSQTLAVEDDPLSQCFFHILLISFSLNEVHGRAFCLAGRVSVVATAYIMP